ncbi:aminoimidazole riboside kinase [Posidoniimonas polymericola]|uniref:Aminoimidazole riboside kinase n=1 Tax=Posidoniimonas polymericola TaxID=2528002 RepID=A0A5C5YUQ7_9BACT|nr:PfkB family carbohydrate kinase [Posidoniimonas polymericola]TWT78560.1 aminoimidazole riboside kinase [Posidoniimonas polymericola]
MPDQPLIVGEVLIDQFPDGRGILGGAPFNVAWNLCGFGMSPMMVTSVGSDESGRNILERMREWGMSTAGVQTSATLPTGLVEVTVNDGEPSYNLLANRAYDDIHYPEQVLAEGGFGMLYVGSLAYRAEPSRTTIRRLMAESGLPKFVDINIRRPWFTLDMAGELLQDATWTKLNNNELAELSGVGCETPQQAPAAVEELRKRFNGKNFFVTCGGEGACAVDEAGGTAFAKSPPPEPMVDTVGAGDAFAAACIAGVTQGRPLAQTIESAVAFASKTCTLQGATTSDRSHYAALVV